MGGGGWGGGIARSWRGGWKLYQVAELKFQKIKGNCELDVLFKTITFCWKWGGQRQVFHNYLVHTYICTHRAVPQDLAADEIKIGWCLQKGWFSGSAGLDSPIPQCLMESHCSEISSSRAGNNCEEELFPSHYPDPKSKFLFFSFFPARPGQACWGKGKVRSPATTLIPFKKSAHWLPCCGGTGTPSKNSLIFSAVYAMLFKMLFRLWGTLEGKRKKKRKIIL